MTICTKRDCKIEKLTLVSDKAYKKNEETDQVEIQNGIFKISLH